MKSKSKGKTMAIIFIIIIILLLLLGAFGVKKWLESRILDGDGMVNPMALESVTYYSGQDEYGRSESFNFENGSLEYCRSGGTVEESVKISYIDDSSLEQSLENAVTQYGMKEWTELPQSDLLIDDGPMSKMTIEFYDGTVISLGDYYEMTEKGWSAVSEVIKIFQSYMEEHEPVSESDSTDDSQAMGEDVHEIVPADDTGLTIIVDYCKKRIATVGGDGYSEIVLYRNDSDGSYQLHTYSKYEGEEEEHYAYTASQKTAEEVLKLIDENKLADYKEKSGMGMCGAEYVVKFRQGEELIRISTANFNDNELNKLTSVGGLMYSYLP